MKKFVLFFSLVLCTSAFAESFDADQTMKALSDLGVRQSGTKVSAMSSLSMDENGKMTEHLGVSFARIVGSSNLEAKALTVYETSEESVLVMTYSAGIVDDSIVTKTQIIPVTGDSAKVIAAVVKANGVPHDNSSSPTLKITAYSISKIACGRVVYPGAKASCSIEK